MGPELQTNETLLSPDARRWLAAIAAAAPGAGVVVFDDEWRVQFVDGPWSAGLGIEPMVGRRLPDLMSAESWAALKEPYRAAVAGQTTRFEFVSAGARFSIHVSPLALAGQLRGGWRSLNLWASRAARNLRW